MGKNTDIVNFSQHITKDKDKAKRLNFAIDVDQQISDIFDKIEKLPSSLISLNLNYNYLREKHMPRLVELLKKFKFLKSIHLAGNFHGEHSTLMFHLKNIIVNHPKLNLLNISNCDISDQDLSDLMNSSHGIKLAHGICRSFYLVLKNNKLTSKSAELALSGQFCPGTLKNIASNIYFNDPQPIVQDKLEAFYHAHFESDFKYPSKTSAPNFEQSVMQLRSGRIKP